MTELVYVMAWIWPGGLRMALHCFFAVLAFLWSMLWWNVSLLCLASFLLLVLCKVKRPFWWAHLNVWEFKFGRSTPTVLTSHGQDEFKFGRSAGRSTPQKTTTIAMHNGIYIMGCIWQPFWILQEKVRISFCFWIIRGSKQSVSIVEWCQM